MADVGKIKTPTSSHTWEQMETLHFIGLWFNGKISDLNGMARNPILKHGNKSNRVV